VTGIAAVIVTEPHGERRHLRLGHGWVPERAAAGVIALALDGLTVPAGARWCPSRR
jgi:hypothetical protein